MKKIIAFLALFFLHNAWATELSVAIMNSEPEHVKTALLNKRLSPSEKEKYLDLADKIVDFRKDFAVLITGLSGSAAMYFAIKNFFRPRPRVDIDRIVQSISGTVVAVSLILIHRWAFTNNTKTYFDALKIKELLYDA